MSLMLSGWLPTQNGTYSPSLTLVCVLQTTYNGTGQPAPGEVWSSYGLSFTGTNCSSNLTSYGSSGVGIGPAPVFNGAVANVTGVS